MIQNVLTHLGGIGLYGVLSLCLFCTVFAGVLAWTFVLRRAHLDRMARLPLDNDDINQPNTAHLPNPATWSNHQ